MIRAMTDKDVKALRALVRLCHPEWKDKTKGWYTHGAEGIQHHTLVMEQDGALVAYTVWGITPAGHAFGRDHGTHPAWRGKGIAQQMHAERLRLAKAAGATHFVGMTWGDNAPMIRVLEKAGGKHATDIPNFYPENHGPDRDGRSYVVELL